VRILFLKQDLAWPRARGHDIHGFHMMQALERAGHLVSLATVAPPSAEALAGLRLSQTHSLETGDGHATSPRLSRLQERFCSYWGVERRWIAAAGKLASELEADAVIAVGLNALPWLAAVEHGVRVWYVADDPAWHHLSQIRWTSVGSWNRLSHAFVSAAYERAFAATVDRVWVVSETDRRAMRLFAGIRHTDVIANGVDGDYFHPSPGPTRRHSCVFWGRLDFSANIDALTWFSAKVWPALRREVSDAHFSIFGFNPTPAVCALARAPGVSLVADLPDLRPAVSAHQVVVFPFVTGGGIKNKVLEAASMGKAIVSSPRGCNGLRADVPLPLVRAVQPRNWIRAIRELWDMDEERQRLESAARAWVLRHHSWTTAAREAAAGLQRSLRSRCA
jgi:glycosyltransferase involved in cell wall biosynthesis